MLPNTFTAVRRASIPVFIFCAHELIFGGTMGVRSRFHVFAPELVFDGIEGVRSFFHVFRARTHFRRYRGRRVPFSYFARPDSFFVVPRASFPIFMFCAPEHVFDNAEGVESRFQVLFSPTRFRLFRGRWVLFSSFASPHTFSAVPRASGPVFLFCTPGLIFDGIEGVGSRFHILRAQTRFRRFR
jgi:hypothetical protein